MPSCIAQRETELRSAAMFTITDTHRLALGLGNQEEKEGEGELLSRPCRQLGVNNRSAMISVAQLLEKAGAYGSKPLGGSDLQRAGVGCCWVQGQEGNETLSQLLVLL